MGPRARKWLSRGAIVGLAAGVLGWQMRSRCDNEMLALELVRVEQLANTTMGLQSARGHALDALANACSGQPEWVAADLRSGGAFGTDVVGNRPRSRFETWLTCDTERWKWWWEMPTSSYSEITHCGYHHMFPFTESERAQLKGNLDFHFWAAAAKLERDGVAPGLLRRYLRVLLLARDEAKIPLEFVITPGRIHTIELGEPRVIDTRAAAAVDALVNELEQRYDEYGLVVAVDTRAGDLAWLGRVERHPQGMWTLDARGPSGMPIRGEVVFIAGDLVNFEYINEEYDILRLEIAGWRINTGTLQPYSELPEPFDGKRVRVEIASDVQAAQFMPILDQLYAEGRLRNPIIIAIN